MFGSIAVAGAATLAGTLKADVLSGYSPSASDVFKPITFASQSGTFFSFSLPSGAGYQFSAAVNATNVTLNAAPATPIAVSWVGGTTGYWDAASNWSNSAVPAANADVTINPASPATVTIQSGDAASVDSVTVGANNALLITGGSLTTAAGLTNSGSVTVSAGCNLTVGGNYVENAGATLSMPGGGDPTFPTSNLVANSGFELPVAGNSTTQPSTWVEYGTGYSPAYLSTQYAHGGSQSLMMTGSTDSAAFQNFTAAAGVSYTESLYAMTPTSSPLSGTTIAQMQLLFYNSSGTLLNSYSGPNDVTILSASSATSGPVAGSVGNQGWNHFWTTAVAPANTASGKVLIQTFDAQGGSVYWDDVTVGPAAAIASTLAAETVSNSGNITLGPTNKITTTSTFAQTSSGTLDIQIGNSPSTNIFGSVTAGGAATWAGTLKAETVYSYSPSVSDIFMPITYPSESGTFSTFLLPGGTGCQLAGATTFTNVTLSAYPTTSLTATVNASSVLQPVTTNLLGVNLANPDADVLTTQTQQMVQAAGLDFFRFGEAGPNGGIDGWHFNVNNSPTNYAQFLQLVAGLGGTGMAGIDYGSASPQEAAAELAYTLGSPSDATALGTGIQWNTSTSQWQNVNWGTVGYWASLRAATPLTTDDGLNFLRIGQLAPFNNVKYWEVGNEEYLTTEMDHHGTAGPGGVSTGTVHDPATYAAFCEQFATFAAEITSTAGLPAISIGIDSGNPTGAGDNNWTKNVLAEGWALGFAPGFISDHNYMYAGGSENDNVLLNQTVSSSASLNDWAVRYADYEATLQATLPSQQAAGVAVMATEYNSVWNNQGKQITSLVDGLFIANSIGSLMDTGYQCGCVWDLRNYWVTTHNLSNTLYGWREGGDWGILGDPRINTPPSTTAYDPYPSYFALQLASKIVQSGGQVVSTTSNYTDLDTYAVLEPSGDLDLMVINTNPAADLTEQFNWV